MAQPIALVPPGVFWSKVDRSPESCWLWTGRINRHGYGEFSLGVGGGHYYWRAHRVSYELLVGLIPEGLVIDHLCRNRACVNPAHLEPVTNRENLRRGAEAHRAPWIDEAVRLYPTLSTSQLGARFGVHRQSVTNALRSAGVTIQRPGRPDVMPARCGTTSGYKAHRRRGEPTCASCKAARAAYMRNWSSRI